MNFNHSSLRVLVGFLVLELALGSTVGHAKTAQVPYFRLYGLSQIFDPSSGLGSSTPNINLYQIDERKMPYFQTEFGGQEIPYREIEADTNAGIDAELAKGLIKCVPKKLARITPNHEFETYDDPSGEKVCSDYSHITIRGLGFTSVLTTELDVHFGFSGNAYPQVTVNPDQTLSISYIPAIFVNAIVRSRFQNMNTGFASSQTVSLNYQARAVVDITNVSLDPLTPDQLITADDELNRDHVAYRLEKVGGNVDLPDLQVISTSLGTTVLGAIGTLIFPGIGTLIGAIIGFIAGIVGGTVLEDALPEVIEKELDKEFKKGIEKLDKRVRDEVENNAGKIRAIKADIARFESWAARAKADATKYGLGDLERSATVSDVFNRTYNVRNGQVIYSTPGQIGHLVLGTAALIRSTLPSGSKSISGRIRFPRAVCVYQPVGGGHTQSGTSTDYMGAIQAANQAMEGKPCTDYLGSARFQRRGYLGSRSTAGRMQFEHNGDTSVDVTHTDDTEIVPVWQDGLGTLTGGTVRRVTENGNTFLACDFTVSGLPSLATVRLAVKPGGPLVSVMYPDTSDGDPFQHARIRNHYNASAFTELSQSERNRLYRTTLVTPAGNLNEYGAPGLFIDLGESGPQRNEDCPGYSTSWTDWEDFERPDGDGYYGPGDEQDWWTDSGYMDSYWGSM